MSAIEMEKQQDVMIPIRAAQAALGYPTTLDHQSDAAQTMPDILAQSLAKYASRPAYSCMGQTINYAELDCLSRKFAAFLQNTLRLQPGDRVALQLPNVLQYPVAVFGALRAGMVVVNVNPLYTPDEMQHQLSDSGATAIVILANMASKLESIIAKTQLRHVVVTELADLHPFPKRFFINAAVRYLKKMVPAYHLLQAISFRNALAQGDEKNLQATSIKANDIAVLQYTGGTTGVAKGVKLTHANLLANMRQCRIFMEKAGVKNGGEVALAPLPLYHIYAFMLHTVLLVESGSHSVLIPNPRDLDSVVDAWSNNPCSFFVGINTLFVALSNHAAFQKLNFSALKLTFSGGMALTETAAKRWKTVTGCSVLEGYGMTETSPVVTINPYGAAKLGTIGIPVADVTVKVVDNDDVVQPVGEAGELCVQGPQVMQGYWQRDDETQKTIINGWLHTGDIAVVDPDGYIRIVDRKKDMIIVSGFNVYPNEVENVMSAHPDVVECAVVGVPSEKTGEAVKLFVVSRNPALTKEDLKAYAREHLTGYKAPDAIEFRDSLPKSNVGKNLRRELRDGKA
ncbi:MAG: AMP-binding protein [Pseudomonadales bacterium]